jgi:serine/threonine protein kinase
MRSIHPDGPAYNASAADMWSCGVILAAVLTGRMPFPAQFQPSVAYQHMQLGAAAVELPKGVSEECAHLLSQLLQPDPVKRISAEQVMQAAWFRQGLPAGALGMNDRYMAAHSVKAPSTLPRSMEEHARMSAAESESYMSLDDSADQEITDNTLGQTTIKQVCRPQGVRGLLPSSSPLLPCMFQLQGNNVAHKQLQALCRSPLFAEGANVAYHVLACLLPCAYAAAGEYQIPSQ